MNLAQLSTWIGLIVYAAGVAFFVIVLGIAIANYQARRNVRSLFSGAAAVCAALYLLALAAIASDWFPWFSGLYFALALRCLFGGTIFFAYVALIIYLWQRWRGAPC